MEPVEPQVRIAVRVLLAFAAVALLVALLIAVTLPYGQFDALAFGTWSRLLAAHFPKFHFGPTDVPVAAYHRPLFFVLQAALWKAFGFREWLGRLLSLAFSVVLVASVGILAGRAAPASRRLAGAVAAGVALTSSLLAVHVASGLTDVPAAAMVALAAVALTWRTERARLQLGAVVAATALAGLTKPSTYPALAGLALAGLLGPRADLRRRLPLVLALAAGTGLALAYDDIQARHFGTSLRAFLQLGTGGVYALEATARRQDVLLAGGWLGGDVRVLLAVGAIYALLRLLLPHRRALLASLAGGVAWTVIGVLAAGQGSVGSGLLGSGGALERLSVVALLCSLLLGLAAPPDAIPSPLQLARLLVWAAPAFATWAAYGVYDNRLGSVWWPPAFLIMSQLVITAFTGASTLGARVVYLPLVALVAVAAFNLENVNGLGPDGWRQYRSGGISGLGDAALMRNVALGGDFSAEVNDVVARVRPGDRILSTDGRLRFYYLGRVTTTAPQRCVDARGYALFVLLESDEMRASQGARAAPGYWLACRSLGLHLVDERAGAFAILSTRAESGASSAGSCGAPAPTPGLTVQFGRFTTPDAAQAKLKAIVAVGFVQAKVEQLGCQDYRVVETGIPDRKTGESVVAEARSAKLRAVLVSTP